MSSGPNEISCEFSDCLGDGQNVIIRQNDFVPWPHLLKHKNYYREAECYQNTHERKCYNEIPFCSVMNMCLKDSEDTPWMTGWVLEGSLTVPITDTQFGPQLPLSKRAPHPGWSATGPQNTSWITLVLDVYPHSLVGLVWLG